MREYEALVAFDADGTLAAFDRAECFEDFVVIDIFVVVEVGLLVGLTGFAVVGANVVGDKVGGGVTIAGQKAPLAAVTSSTIVHPMKSPAEICSVVQSSMLYPHAKVLITSSLLLLTPVYLRINPPGKYSSYSCNGLFGSNFDEMEVNSIMSPSDRLWLENIS